MSRTSRKAAKRRNRILVVATLLSLAAVGVMVGINRLLPEAQPVQGSTDTNTLVLSSENTQTDATDTPDVSVSSEEKTTQSETDTSVSTDTGSKTTNSSTDSSTDSSAPITAPDDNSGVNEDGSFDFTAWNLILLNPDNPLPEGYSPQLTTVTLNGYSARLDARIVEAMSAMFAAAKADGITLIPRSTYRNLNTQTTNFNNKVQEYINKGYSYEDAVATTATIIAVPGTSEHHTGLAADITTPSYNRLDSGFAKTDAYRWLSTHCAEFGFILRYPQDKTDVTKIIYEPWHYRYVGKKAAQIIMSEGICYEEFVAKYGNP